jgi:putative endonuclease
MEVMPLSCVGRGRVAEDIVAGYLDARGWMVIGRNVRTPVGELDLVCRDAEATVVVEVKARADNRFGDGLEAVGPRKERRLRAAAAWWMAETGEIRQGVRFDVVVVSLDKDGSVRSLAHVRDVLNAG